jgi:voltage-gated potassium channel
MNETETDVTEGRRIYRRHAQLLGALIVFQIGAPAAQSVSPALGPFVLLPLYVVVLATATLVMSSSRRRVLIGALSMPVVVAAVATGFKPAHGSLLLSASTAPFLAYAAGVVLSSVLAPGVINQARLLGSASVFILVAQAWAAVYAGFELIFSGTFAITGEDSVRPGDLTYFSFVTQTTLGYGDVTPTSAFARAAATLQATAGLFYMGVIVARFAGRLQLTDRHHRQRHEIRPNRRRDASS